VVRSRHMRRRGRSFRSASGLPLRSPTMWTVALILEAACLMSLDMGPTPPGDTAEADQRDTAADLTILSQRATMKQNHVQSIGGRNTGSSMTALDQ
jgi:hypothetical protein